MTSGHSNSGPSDSGTPGSGASDSGTPDPGTTELEVPSGEEVVEELESMQIEESSDSDVWIPGLVLEWLGALVVIVLSVAITAGVVARFFGTGIFGVVELSALSMVVMVLLGSGALAARDGHVKLELLDTVLKPRQLKAVNILSDVVQIVVTALLTWAMFSLFLNDLDRGTTVAGDVQFPRVVLAATAMVCFAVLCLTILLRLIRDLRRPADPTDTAESPDTAGSSDPVERAKSAESATTTDPEGDN